MTLAQIKALNDSVIRQKTLPNTITTDNVADLLDDLADFSTTISVSAPSGSEGSVQYNASGAFAGNSNFKYIADQGLVFDSPTNVTEYTFLQADPIDTFTSQLPFRMIRWNSPQNGGAVAGNEGLMMGFNIGAGGGVIESGKPGIGESWESNYLGFMIIN